MTLSDNNKQNLKKETKVKLPKLLVIVSLCIISLSLAMGCSKSLSTTKTTTTTTQTFQIPSNYTTYTDEIGLFSISYPPDWESALSSIPDAVKAIQDIVKAENSNIKLENAKAIFFAGKQTSPNIYAPNVNVVVEPSQGLTLDQYIESAVKLAKNLVPDYHEVSRITTTVDGRKAIIIEVDGTFPQLGKLHCLQQYILVGNNVSYLLTTLRRV